jgi:hypothetical protein
MQNHIFLSLQITTTTDESAERVIHVGGLLLPGRYSLRLLSLQEKPPWRYPRQIEGIEGRVGAAKGHGSRKSGHVAKKS